MEVLPRIAASRLANPLIVQSGVYENTTEDTTNTTEGFINTANKNQVEKKDYDAVVVGSGPNGLSAAITLQQAGLSVLLLEGKETIGGGLRSAELTLPGYIHDVCSAIHP